MKKLYVLFFLILSLSDFSYAKSDFSKDFKNTDNKKPEIYTVNNYYHNYRGVKSSDGKILLKPMYFRINEADGFYFTKPFPSYSVYSMTGEKILEIPNVSVEYYDKDFAIVRDENGCYLANPQGKKLSKYYSAVVIEPVFRKVILFWPTGNEKHSGVMNFKGKVIVNDLLYAIPEDNGSVIAILPNNNRKIFRIDKNGKRTIISEEEYGKIVQKYEDIRNKTKIYLPSWAFSKNSDGEEIIVYGINCGNENIIPKKYEETSIGAGNTKYFGYKEHNLWGVKTIPDEKTVLIPMFKNPIKVVNDYILVNKAPKLIVFDKNFNKIFESHEIEGIDKPKGNYITALKKIGFKIEYGFINENGETVIDFKYRYANNFSDDLAAVQNHKDLWGYINKKGETVIDFQYYYAGDFKDGTAKVILKDKKTRAVIDKSGNILK